MPPERKLRIILICGLEASSPTGMYWIIPGRCHNMKICFPTSLSTATRAPGVSVSSVCVALRPQMVGGKKLPAGAYFLPSMDAATLSLITIPTDPYHLVSDVNRSTSAAAGPHRNEFGQALCKRSELDAPNRARRPFQA